MSEEKLITELLESVNYFRCIHHKLYHSIELNMSDMLVFGAVLRAESNKLPPPKMGEIAARVNLSTAAISQIVSHLEEKDLVVRYAAQNDRRTVYLRITSKGKALFNEEQQMAREKMAQAIDKMGFSEAQQLLSLISKFQNIIKEL